VGCASGRVTLSISHALCLGEAVCPPEGSAIRRSRRARCAMNPGRFAGSARNTSRGAPFSHRRTPGIVSRMALVVPHLNA
jgi:hypothetical protein